MDEQGSRGAGGEEGRPEGFDWEGSEDLTAVSEDHLRQTLSSLAEEERALSFRRRVIQGRIDLIRAELVRRGGVALSPEELARVLLDGSPGARGTGEPGGDVSGPEGGRGV
jgi:hypothetical protein